MEKALNVNLDKVERKSSSNFNDWSQMSLKSNHIHALISHMTQMYENLGNSSTDISHLMSADKEPLQIKLIN